MQTALLVGFDPRDVVADRPHLPALFLQSRRRDEHREIRFSARARERRRNVGLFAPRIFYAKDQHVFGHPAFVAGHVGGDAQRETLFAEQRVAAVARAVGPDLARLGKVHDVFFAIAGPRHVLLPLRKRRPDRVHTRHDAFFVLIDLLKHRQADSGHNAHVDDHVGRVGQLHAELRQRRPHRTHAEGQHIHRAPCHAALEERLQLFTHLKRIFPIIRRARRFPGQRTDKRAVFDARHVGRVGPRVITTGPKLIVEFLKRATLHHLRAQRVVFLLRAVDPVNRRRLGEFRHLGDPLEQVGVFAERLRGRARFHKEETVFATFGPVNRKPGPT